MENGNGNEKLAAWQKRIDTAREKIAAEKECLRQQKARETERLHRTVGEACCKAGWRCRFRGALRQVLDRTTDTKVREFLSEKGML